MKTFKVAILGGGVAGITAAKALASQKGMEVTIIEKAPKLGGLSKGTEFDGLKYDIGAFLYSDIHWFFRIFPFLKDVFVEVRHVPTSIYGKGRYGQYPFHPKTYRKEHGNLNFALSSLSLLFGKLRYRNIETLTDYCQYYLGERVYKKSGLQRYVKRLYKRDDHEVDVKLGYSRMKTIGRFGLRKIIKKALSGQAVFNFRRPNSQIHVRPENGFGEVFRLLENHLLELGVIVSKNKAITGIRKIDGRYEISSGEGSDMYDGVISSIPFTVTQKLIGKTPDYLPSYMSLLTLFYKGEILVDKNVFYNFTQQGEWKRITVFSKYYGRVDNQDYFCTEITIDPKQENDVDQLREEFETHIRELGIADRLDLRGYKIIPFAYPFFGQGEMEKATHELDVIRNYGIGLIGRQGSFDYMTSSETVEATWKYIMEEYLPSLKKESLQANLI